MRGLGPGAVVVVSAGAEVLAAGPRGAETRRVTQQRCRVELADVDGDRIAWWGGGGYPVEGPASAVEQVVHPARAGAEDYI